MQRKSWVVAAAFAAHTLSAHAAHPGLIFWQEHVANVKVVSTNDTSYDDIAGQSYPLSTQIAGNCPDSAVESVTVTATGIAGAQQVDFSDLRPGDREVSLRPVLVPYSLTPISWPAQWKQTVLAACNANLVSQMNARHWTRAQVLARDWPLGEVKVAELTSHLGCKSTGNGTQFDPNGADYHLPIDGRVRLTCGKTMVDDFAAPKKPKTPTDDLTYGVHVVQAHLSILPKTGGNGPCGVTLSGVIETDAINTTVTFFYKNNKGGTTPWRSVKTDHSKTAFFSDFIEFNKPGVQGGLTTAQPGAHGPAGNTFAAPQSGKDFSGTYQMIGKNMAFESNIGHFAFDCAVPPVTNFAGAKPQPPAKPLTTAPVPPKKRATLKKTP
jgi:hypothetical protein